MGEKKLSYLLFLMKKYVWKNKKIIKIKNLIEKIKIILANLFLNQFSSNKQRRKLFISENVSTAPDVFMTDLTCSLSVYHVFVLL